MKYIWAKAGVCAIAAAIMLGGSGYQTKAANSVLASLPAAGLGLTMEDGSSIASIRNDVKQKKAQQQETTASEAAQETVQSDLTGAEAGTLAETQQDTPAADASGAGQTADGGARTLGSTAEEETLMDAS